MAQKPVLWSDSRPEVERFNPYRLHDLDPSRIPGYSEIVKANSISEADDLVFREQHRASKGIRTKEDAYKVIGAAPRDLEVEFRWLPVSGPAGGAISYNQARQLDKYREQGFRPVSVAAESRDAAEKDFREQFGFEFPPTAHVEADGTIRRGSDVALYVRSGEVARLWERYEREEAARREGSYLPDTLHADGMATEAFSEEEREQALVPTRK